MLNRREWNSFVRAACRKPWRVPGYAFELACLSARRVGNRWRLRNVREVHRGVRQRPSWLASTPLTIPATGALRWPAYPAAYLAAVPHSMPVLPPADAEAYLQTQRWPECAIGAIVGGAVAEAALSAALRWMHSPRPKSDPAWEPYSAGERVANIAILLSACPALREQADTNLLRHFLADSAHWLDGHLEYYGEARSNNHFLNNARALVIAGSVLNAPDVLARGLAIFTRFAPRLFAANGFLRERSSHYQLVVAGWFFDVLHFARAAGAEIGALAAMEGAIVNACAQLYATLPDMDVHIGDISPDFPPPLSAARLARLYPEVLQARGPLPAGDWCLLRRDQDTLVTCVPPAWPLPYTTHGHADLGSFIWRHAGRTVLADPGRAAYHTPAGQAAQIDARAHNCLLLDDMPPLAESVLSAGLWFPRRYAQAGIVLQAEAQGFSVEHDGFLRLRRDCHHRREVSMHDGSLTVTDSLSGTGSAHITLLWHAAPGFSPATQTSLTAAGASLEIDCTSAQGAPVQRAWESYRFSSAYGAEQPATKFVAVFAVQLPCVFHSHFKVTTCVV